MQTVSCPSCGADVVFRANLSLFRVCASCGTAIARKDMTDAEIENLGKVAALPPDVTVIQLGTKGTFKGLPFEVIGRMRLAYPEGHWNEWYLSFGAGGPGSESSQRDGWLAEAQGEFMVSFAQKVDPDRVRKAATAKVGQMVDLGSAGKWYVGDIKTVGVVASEGELPTLAVSGRQGLSIDLGTQGGNGAKKGGPAQFASLELPTRDVPRFYAGEYVDFEALKLRDIRRYEGWEY